MTQLNAEPAGQVRSMEEFFALAHAIETDAVARYADTSRMLRAEGFQQLADLFEHLAGLERQHVGQVEQWAARKAVNPIPSEPWPIPDTFDAPPQEIAHSRLMTPYRALASAVRHEQRAFAFWTYVSANAGDDDVRRAAERMALEELEHAALLRRERRRAFRDERGRAAGASAVASFASLAATERHLAALLDRLQTAEDGRRRFASLLADRCRAAAATLQGLAAVREVKLRAQPMPAGHEDDVAALSEYLAEAYLSLADAARDEAELTAAQELAAIAVNRLGLLDPAFPVGASGS